MAEGKNLQDHEEGHIRRHCTKRKREVKEKDTANRDATVVEEGYESADLWHKRLGERGLQELQKQGLLCRDKLEKLDFCEHYVYGKATRVKFSSSIHKTKEILSYVHSDL
ncbi:hypothetical protein EZV62_002929 [Acer yangbiense]|uniref:GAG-pre-integrase domain-containing protein n=1 Tax=Acer yangbiense TaxID=1000413 RepID=A0A5C7IYN3_9ROSI|nr:hypothetical protein EZV62_002929 [Acer yangbiense]